MIKVKISLQFNKIQFLGNKFQEGRRIDRLEEDVEMYLKKDWKAYKEQLAPGTKLSWVKVAEAVCYLCRCFVPERTKLKKMTPN